jgi:hypothetical protein
MRRVRLLSIEKTGLRKAQLDATIPSSSLTAIGNTRVVSKDMPTAKAAV